VRGVVLLHFFPGLGYHYLSLSFCCLVLISPSSSTPAESVSPFFFSRHLYCIIIWISLHNCFFFPSSLSICTGHLIPQTTIFKLQGVLRLDEKGRENPLERYKQKTMILDRTSKSR